MTTKEKILSASAQLFHEKGYAATSMREIASAVGIEASSLYNHIKSKDQLLEEICFSVSRAFQENILRMQSKSSTPLDKMKSLFAFHLEMAAKDDKAITAFNDEWRHLSKTARAKFSAERKAYENVLHQLIIRGQALGQINPQLEAAVATKSILSSLRWMYFSKIPKQVEGREEIYSNWLNLIFHGLLN